MLNHFEEKINYLESRQYGSTELNSGWPNGTGNPFTATAVPAATPAATTGTAAPTGTTGTDTSGTGTTGN